LSVTVIHNAAHYSASMSPITVA